MGRKILAVVVALIVSFGIILIVEMINRLVVIPPSAEIMEDSVRLRDFMTNVPPLGYVIVLIGYFLASFAGGFIVTKMSRQVSQGITLPIIVGAILTLYSIAWIILVPGQPMWFIIIAILMSIPATLFGHRLAR